VVRRREGRRIAGVAAGIGAAFGLDPNLVRVAFVVLALAGGAGVALYGAAWLVLPSEGRLAPLRVVTAPRGRFDVGQAVALGAIVLGTLLLLRQLHAAFIDSIVWPAAVAGVGVALLSCLRRGRRTGRWSRARVRALVVAPRQRPVARAR
jgi:phage shock protein PspC (stress-responsive transcriptional regulator)